MRNVLLLITLALFSLSCQDDIEDNTPSIQGIKDGELIWQASGYSATTLGGLLVISANNNFGDLNLILPSAQVGTYNLDSGSTAEANYQEDGIFYSTKNDGFGSPAITSDGEIVIESIGGEPTKIRATFRFNAYDDSGQLTVNFIEGVVFDIPLN